MKALESHVLVGLSVLPLCSLASCAATLESKMQTVGPTRRVDPPLPGRNQVYVDFQDQTGEGMDFEEGIYDAICDNVERKGYELAPSYHEADYVLWATLRFFDRTDTEEGNKALAGLGGIAGGAAIGVAAYELTDNAWVGWLSGVGGGWTVNYAIDKATQKQHWAMIVDIQLARRVDEEFKKTIRAEDQSRLVQATVAGVQSGVVTEADVGMGTQAISESSEHVETEVFFELEQRVVAQATSRRKSKEEVAESLIERLSNGVASQLPRKGGRNERT